MSLSSATAAAALLGQVELNRRALVYVSDGYGVDVRDFLETRALVSVARASGVRLFTIDAARLDRLPPSSIRDRVWQAHRAAERNSLRIIAEQGGGLAVVDVKDVHAALEQIERSIRR
jgi:hypothetical protein